MQIRPDNRAGPLGANPMMPTIRRAPPPRRRGGAPPPAPDPFASILAGYPHPQTDAELGRTAQGMIDPLLSALTDRITQQATAGSNAIRGYTNQTANDLGQYAGSAKDIFGRAEADTAAANNSLADRLSGGGAKLAAGLVDRLKGIGDGTDPAIAGIASGVAQTGTGSGNAVYATGNAALENLIARGASAEDYAAKLPEYARLEGVQRAGQLQQTAQNDIAQGASDIRGRLPELIQSLRSANDAKATNLADTRQHLLEYRQGRQDTKDQNAANMRERAVLAKMAAETDATKAAQDWQKFVISENDRNQRATDAEAGRNGRTQAQIDAANARAAAAAAARAAAAKTKADAKPNPDYPNLTKAQVVHLRSGIAAAFNGVPEQKDASGKVTQNALPPVSYQDAINHAVSAGYSRAAATKMANHFYMPGQRGRPGASKDPAVNPNAAGPPAPGTGP